MGIKRNNMKNGICSAYCTILLHQDVSTHQIKKLPIPTRTSLFG